MIIKNIFGTHLTEIEQRKFNIYLGISLGNHYFSNFALKSYLDWMLEYTQEKVLLLIADSLHAINYRVFKNLSEEQSLIEAEQEGTIIWERVKKIIASSYSSQADRIIVLRWTDIIENNKDYLYRLEILTEEFENNDHFRALIIQRIKANLGSRCKGLIQGQYHQLSSYLLEELAAEIDGILYDGILYNLQPYPGNGISLFVQARDQTMFPDLTKRLEINHPIGVVEGYVDTLTKS